MADSTTPEDKSSTRGLGEAIGSNFNAAKIAEIVLTLDNAASEMLKQFGQGQEMSDILRMSMAESVTSVRKLGGDIADVIKIQKDAAEGLGRNITLTEETTKDLYATMQVTGQSVKEIVNGMADAGIGSGKAADEMLKVVNVARESGVNAVAVSGKVLANMDALNKYNFEGGVEGLAKMAAQATSLRIDMSQTLGFAEKVFNPEGAIEVAAAMQRLGVSQSSLLDPLKLMDLSQNDPAELQNQIAQMSKQFVQLGKDGHFEIMPGAKRQLREISQAMGISYDQITKMALGSADLDKKMKEISFPDVPEDQKKMIANMAEMGKNGEYTVKFTDEKGKEQEKSVSELSKDDVAAIEKMANTAPPTMEELAKQQLSATKDMAAAINSLADRTGLGLAATKAAGTGLKAGKAIAGAIKEIPGENLSAKNIAKGVDETLDTLGNAIHQYAETGKVTADLGGILTNFGSFVKNEMTTAFSNVEKQANEISKAFPVLADITKSIQRATGTLPSTSSTIPRGTTSTNSAGGTQSNNPSTVDVNLNVKVDSNSPNIDSKQMEQIITNPALMEKLTLGIKDGLSKMTPVKKQ
jgi:cyanate lyase